MRGLVLVGVVLAVACVDDPAGVVDMAPETRDLVGADLVGADLTATPDLVAVDLVGADLAVVDLAVDDLTNVDLTNPDLAPHFVETNSGLGGGRIASIAAAGNGTTYAVSAYRVFRSTNSGVAWSVLAPTRSGLAAWTAVALDRTAPDHVVVADSLGRVLRSLDGGGTFDEVISTTGATVRPGVAIKQLAYVSDNLMIALCAERVFRWNGTKWDDQTASFEANSAFANLSVDDGAPPRVYVGSNKEVRYREGSSDTWTVQLSNGVRAVSAIGTVTSAWLGWVDTASPPLSFTQILLSSGPLSCTRPTPSSYSFVATGMQLLASQVFLADVAYVAYRDRDCSTGSLWTALPLSPVQRDGKPATEIVTTTQTNDHASVFLGTNQGVLQSTSLGNAAAWTDRSEKLSAPDVRSIAAMNGLPDRLLAATDRGLFSSVDGGATWQAVAKTGTNPLPQRLPITQVEVGGDRVVVRTSDMRVYWSDDLVEWTELAPGDDTLVAAIGIDRTMKDVMYRCTDTGLQKWEPSPGLWMTLNPGPTSCRALLVHPTQAQNVYVIDALHHLWRSSDRGATWATDGVDRGFTTWALDARDPKRVLLASGTTIYDFVDGVVTGMLSSPTLVPVGALAIDPTPSSTAVYLANDDGLFRSVNGQSFVAYQHDLPHAPAQFVWIDPAAASVVRVSLQHLGLWRN